MEFKVGDKVRILDANKIINNRFKLTKGKEYEVLSFHEKSDTDVEHIKVADNFSKPFMICDWEYKYIEKVDKPTKKQRIEALEKEVAELKERIEALEQAEKQRYLVGVDVVKEVHKTPNQQRKEIIEKAKGFIEKYGEGFLFDSAENHICAAKLEKIQDDVGYGSCIGYSRCHRNDVFNVHIGKAIALGRALGKDVSEFKNAVKPTKVVSGMLCEVVDYLGNKYNETAYVGWDSRHTTDSLNNASYGTLSKIIDDTNAVYEVEK